MLTADPLEVVAYIMLESLDFVKNISVFEIDPVNELVPRLKNFIFVVPESSVVKVDSMKAIVYAESSK